MSTAFDPETVPSSKDSLPRDVLWPLHIGFWTITAFAVCFVLWAIFAPLSTSIHATGHLNTNQPSFDVQHPFGGDVAEVLIKKHDRVDADQVLMRMDVASEVAQKRELEDSLNLLLRERDALDWALARLHRPLTNWNVSPQAAHATASGAAVAPHHAAHQSSSKHRISNMIDALHLRKQAAMQSAEALNTRAQGLRNSISVRKSQRDSMQARLDRFAGLVKSGALRASEHDGLQEDILDLDASILAEKAEAEALASQAQQARLQFVADVVDLRQRLLDRRSRIAETVPRTRVQLHKLGSLIDAAEIRAPAAGTVSQLLFDTDAMYVPRGETVLTITRPLQTHQVVFSIPPFAIDQTRVGMQGHLTVTSLPQRNHPKVRVTIQSLSPEARRNADGAVVGYDGVAAINPDDLEVLREGMGEDLTLSIDMPVTLVFVGRQTTFSEYLVGPFMDFLAKAMQD